jgi:hypothetical protein
MTIAALSWPAASVYMAVIAAVAVVACVLIWSIFRTGRTAIASESQRREASDSRRLSADEA